MGRGKSFRVPLQSSFIFWHHFFVSCNNSVSLALSPTSSQVTKVRGHTLNAPSILFPNIELPKLIQVM